MNILKMLNRRLKILLFFSLLLSNFEISMALEDKIRTYEGIYYLDNTPVSIVVIVGKIF